MNTPTSTAPNAERRRHLIRLAVVTVGLLIPFMFKPANMDDHLFLLIAQRIREAPLDPFGVGVNWFGWAQPMYKAMLNPPGFSYMLAPVTGWAGVVGGHVVGMAWAVAAVFGVYALAEQMGAKPLPSALLALSTPALFISSTTLMCDVPMTATFTWSVVWWQRGLQRDDQRFLWLSALAAIASISLKYFGLSLVPLLVLSAVVNRVSWRKWLRQIVLIGLATALWEVATLLVYETPHIFSASDYKVPPPVGTPSIRAFDGSAYVGGCVIGLLALAPFLPLKRVTLPAIAFGVFSGAMWLLRGTFSWVILAGDGGFEWWFWLQAVVDMAAFTFILAGVVEAVRRAPRLDPQTIVALAWIGGTFVFTIGVNWHVAARSMLPLVPPLVVLLVRICQGTQRALLLACVPGAVYTLVAADGDLRIANAQVDAAEAAVKLAPVDHVWFEGHWGFQTAMEERGAFPLDIDTSPVRRGDVIVWPSVNYGLTMRDLRAGLVEDRPPMLFPTGGLATTVQGGGFYSSNLGPWPVLLRRSPPLRLNIAIVVSGVEN